MSPTSPESTTSEDKDRSKSHSWLVLLIFALTAICLYWPSFKTPFIFDDDRTVSLNENIMHLWPADWLLHESRPAGSLTFALNYQLTGLSLTGFHLTNTAIHVLSAWVLFLLLSLVLRLPGKDQLPALKAQGLAFAVALIWLVHPLNTQAVSYIAQRYESQMGLFFLTTIYCLTRGSLATKGSKWGWYVGAIAAGWLGMGTKEVMCTVLVVGPLFDRAFLASTWKEVVRQRGWVYASIVPSLVLMLLLQRAINAELGPAFASAGFGLQSVTPWEYFRTQPEIILHYIGISILPRQLIFDYAWPVQNDLIRVGISGLVVLALFVGSILLYMQRPRWGVAALSFFLILGPTSSFMPIADLAVEHRMYLPLISVCIAAVMLGHAWLARMIASESARQRCAYALAAVAVVFLSLRTFARNEDYRQPIRLYAQNVKFNPANRRAHNNLAVELKALGLRDEARQHFEIATKLEPRHAHAYYQLGLMAAEERDFATALNYFSKSLKLEPQDQAAAYCRGLCFMELGEDQHAVDAFSASLKVNPQHVVTRRELAWVLATSTDEHVRNGQQALQIAQELQASRPSDPRLMEVLAAAQAETGEFQLATSTAETALAVAENSGWSETKRAAIAAALAGYRSEQPLRRSRTSPAESKS